MKEKLCSNSTVTTQAEVELWAALVAAEGMHCQWQPGEAISEAAFQAEEDPNAHIAYPWDPTSSETEAFFNDLEAPDVFEGLPETEITHRAQSFFTQVNQLWPVTSLEASLMERFAARAPKALLAGIARQVQQAVANTEKAVVESSVTLADQLIYCVRELVPSLADDDFYVLARPLAGSLRNGGLRSAIDAQLAQVPNVGWEQLSDLQQVRLSLAIARYAMAQAQSQL